MCIYTFISQPELFILKKHFHWLVFITEEKRVYYAVRTESFMFIDMSFTLQRVNVSSCVEIYLWNWIVCLNPKLIVQKTVVSLVI